MVHAASEGMRLTLRIVCVIWSLQHSFAGRSLSNIKDCKAADIKCMLGAGTPPKRWGRPLPPTCQPNKVHLLWRCLKAADVLGILVYCMLSTGLHTLHLAHLALCLFPQGLSNLYPCDLCCALCRTRRGIPPSSATRIPKICFILERDGAMPTRLP